MLNFWSSNAIFLAGFFFVEGDMIINVNRTFCLWSISFENLVYFFFWLDDFSFITLYRLQFFIASSRKTLHNFGHLASVLISRIDILKSNRKSLLEALNYCSSIGEFNS